MPNKDNTRYTDEELEEFRQIINSKLAKAQSDLDQLVASLNNSNGNGDSDTAPTFKVLEEGAATLNQEETSRSVERGFDKNRQQDLRHQPRYRKTDSGRAFACGASRYTEC